MTKNRFMQILSVVLIALIVIGITLAISLMLLSDERRVIRVDLAEDRVIEFEDLSLVPGSECKYEIILEGEAGIKYDTELIFKEKAESPLKDYVHTRIEFNGELVCDELLTTLLNNDSTDLCFTVSGGEDSNISIVYYLPEEIGNEAQNAEAVFELLITANNK